MSHPAFDPHPVLNLPTHHAPADWWGVVVLLVGAALIACLLLGAGVWAARRDHHVLVICAVAALAGVAVGFFDQLPTKLHPNRCDTACETARNENEHALVLNALKSHYALTPATAPAYPVIVGGVGGGNAAENMSETVRLNGENYRRSDGSVIPCVITISDVVRDARGHITSERLDTVQCLVDGTVRTLTPKQAV